MFSYKSERILWELFDRSFFLLYCSMSESQVRQGNYLYGALLVFIGSIFYSSKAVIVKLAYQYDVDSISLLALRMSFSIPVFLLIGLLKLKRDPGSQEVLRQNWWKIILLGTCGYYLASLLDFIGLQYITASMERVVLFTYPTIVLLLSAVFLKKRMVKRQVLALLITYVGIAIAFLSSLADAEQANLLLGSLLVFGAALAVSIYVVGSGELLPKLGTQLYNSFAMLAAGIAIVIHHFLTNDLALFNFEMEVYAYAFLMAMIATVIPSFLVAEGIRVVGANNAGLIGSIGPISTIVLAYIFLGERLDFYQWFGTILVIVGVLSIVLWKE